MEAQVVDVVTARGPRTGAELAGEVRGDTFALWKACLLSPRLEVRRVGRRYVRLDRRVPGFTRLSPSILREFLTYCVVGLSGDRAALDARAEKVQAHVRDVTRKKSALARQIMEDVAAAVAEGDGPENRYCAVLAGDIVHGMAHDVDRPERSTGSMVDGSDLDIVVLVTDDAPPALVRALDSTIYQKKYQYLKNPAFREEIDYVVKRLRTLREQMEFDTFKHMVACKIFDEAVLLTGSEELFATGKALLDEFGVTVRLREMEQVAIADRDRQQRHLLDTDERLLGRDDLLLFHTDEESEEFE